MKIVRKKSKVSKIVLTVIGLLAIVTGIGLASMPANAASDEFQMNPGETGNIYYDTNNVYTMNGTKHGGAWSDQTAAMAVSPDNGSNQKIVFCIQPGVPFTSTDNPGYEAVGVNNIPQDAQIASVIWNTFYGFGNNWTNADRITSQAVIWELLPQYGIKVDAISGIPDFQARKQKLYAGIEEYKRVPEFSKTTVDLTFGETKRLNSSVDLHSFETLVSNSAKVNWNVAENGKSVDVTPTDPNVTSGSIAFKRSFAEGTPIALEKQGSQTVYLPSVKDPAGFPVNFNIKTVGTLKLKKVDENGKTMPGVGFKLTANGKSTTGKTNGNGELDTPIYPVGTVVEYEETETIAGHYIDPATSKGKVTLKEGTNVVTVKNPTLKFSVASQASNQDGAQFVNPTQHQKLRDEVLIEAKQAPTNAKLRLTTDFVEFGTGEQFGEESLKQVTEFEAKQAKFVKNVYLDFDATNLHGKKGVFTNLLE